MENPNFLAKILDQCGADIGCSFSAHLARPIKKADFKAEIEDSADAYTIADGGRAGDSVLLVSNTKHPDMVAHAVKKSREARSVLIEQLAKHVCMPITSGQLDGRSYALYEHLEEISSNRYIRRLQLLAARKSILAWLSRVYSTTRRDLVEENEVTTDFLIPLRTLAQDDSLSLEVRQAARTAEQKLLHKEIQPFKCLQHGDFWTGNILFTRGKIRPISPIYKQFQVIDWAGSRLDGYAGIDALTFVMSAFGQGKRSHRQINRFLENASMEKDEFSVSCLSALGWLARNLNKFPKDRFNGLATDVTRTLNQHAAMSWSA